MVRQKGGIKSLSRNYEQRGVVATVEIEEGFRKFRQKFKTFCLNPKSSQMNRITLPINGSLQTGRFWHFYHVAKIKCQLYGAVIIIVPPVYRFRFSCIFRFLH